MLEIKKHTFYYFTLALILSLGFFIIFKTSYDIKLQTLVLFTITFFYITWGILHHLVKHDLCLKIVVEYILVGLLGLTAGLLFLRG